MTENVVLPFSDFATNQSVSEKLKFLLKSKYWSRDQINDFQNKRLTSLVKYAYESVPFYRNMFRQLGLEPSDIQSKESLNKIPVINKSIVKQNKEIFVSSNISKKDIINKSSSGSTGEPLFYKSTREAYSINIAANLRGWYEMGYRLGDRFVKLSQNGRISKFKRLQDSVTRNLYIKADPLDDENFKRILTKIEEYKPKVIRCYPDPLLFLARYKQKYPEFTHCPSFINTTGNTLHPETRKEIEESFRCKVFDSYSSEGNSCVFECKTQNCYHSAEEYGITEVVDDKGSVITKGIGRLISTDLWNLAHPFIRYDTQDYVEVDNSTCSCGMKHLKINRILGRDNEVLKLPNERKFIVHNFTIFFSVDSKELKRSIDQFQVIKKKDETVFFRLKVNNNYNYEIEEYIKAFWKDKLQTNVDVEVVECIPLTSSGKRRFILNE